MVATKPTAEKRKTYSIAPELSRDLGRVAMSLSDDLKRNVTRQEILDALVSSLADKTVFTKVKATLKA